MTIIPDDIRETSVRLWPKALAVGTPDAAIIIASAILAERERCAKIAEGASSLGRDWVPGSLWETLRRETAADIRNPAVRTPSTPPEGREQTP